MTFAELFSIFSDVDCGEWGDVSVTSLVDDSRDVERGSVFCALKGERSDGHHFLEQASGLGAQALVVESRCYVPSSYKGLVVEVSSSREALAALAEKFYGFPGDSLYCVGVTGTNGKSSVCYMVEAVLVDSGLKTGVIGTVDHHVEERVWKASGTTPSSLQLQRRLSEWVSMGVEAVVVEISSHALAQKRVHNLPLDCAVFTNLSRDHLDFHNDMESYFKEKQKIFSLLKTNRKGKRENGVAVVNRDCSYGERISLPEGVKCIGVGALSKNVELTFDVKESTFSEVVSDVHLAGEKVELRLPTVGEHNVYNACLALGVGAASGRSLSSCVKSLSQFSGVPGRLQRVRHKGGFPVFVDYAHTDDALRNVLKSLREVSSRSGSEGNLIVVFGCGGERDRGKRPLMGQVALEGADIVWVTSDNPRGEDPQDIIRDIVSGFPSHCFGKSVFLEKDRKKAICQALRGARMGDVVLVAGKGHEEGQEVQGQVLPFHDVSVVEEFLS